MPCPGSSSSSAEICAEMRRALPRLIAPALGLGLMGAAARADVTLPVIFGSEMVLQQGLNVPVWGKAEPGEQVTVTFADQTRTVTAGEDGKWRVTLDPLKAATEGRPLTVAGKNTITLEKVLVGEVWLCAGQSNMQMALRSSQGGRDAMNQANPEIRLFTVEPLAKRQPQDDCRGQWRVCTPESAEFFSAVAYYFGNLLQQELKVPVGLINASWGGQNIECFTPRAALSDEAPWSKSLAARIDREAQTYDAVAAQKRYEEALAKWEKSLEAYKQAKEAGTAKGSAPQKPPAPEKAPGPARLYNAMIHPLAPFALRGAIWYQGEANRGDGMLYTEKMRTLIQGWRKVWGQGEFPFLFVQLAPCKYFGDRNTGLDPVTPPSAEIRPSQRFPYIWQAQLDALKIPGTGMAATVDLDGPALHPGRKKEVGERLANWALATVHGRDIPVYSGPLFKGVREVGTTLRVSFDHAGRGLATRDGRDVAWVEVAGEDKVYYPAQAKIDGAELVVSSDQVSAPKYVRYGWDEIAMPNLMNKEGLPASAFISDSTGGPAPPKR
jgi:sialate O-acetylesterase